MANIIKVGGGSSVKFEGNATPSQVLSGAKFYSDSKELLTGTIASLGATTYTPTTSDQTIESGKYLSGNQTIKGDANLVASNIKKGVSIFGVIGNVIKGGKIEFIGTKSYTAVTGTTNYIDILMSDFGLTSNDNIYVICDSGSSSYTIQSIDKSDTSKIRINGAEFTKLDIALFRITGFKATQCILANKYTVSHAITPRGKYGFILAGRITYPGTESQFVSFFPTLYREKCSWGDGSAAEATDEKRYSRYYAYILVEEEV